MPLSYDVSPGPCRTPVPRIVLTPGEPAGVGPELALTIALEPLAVEIIAVADPKLLRQRARALNLAVKLKPFDSHRPAQPHSPGVLPVLPVALTTESRPGRLNPGNAAYVLTSLDQAIDGCLAGVFSALVTGPVHKGVINNAGYPFSGHTEYLATRTAGHPVMMLTTSNLKVALVTTHLPLSRVSAALTREHLYRVLKVLDRDLRSRFGIPSPRILVCGLNPHAGEAGHLGREEIEVITPTLEALRHEGLHLRGPLPADTVFTPQVLSQGDVVLAMYHDQALPVLKYAGFGEAVNITLGLPIIRTSVDHGTALDIAGQGLAHAGSLRQAIAQAIALAWTTPRLS